MVFMASTWCVNACTKPKDDNDVFYAIGVYEGFSSSNSGNSLPVVDKPFTRTNVYSPDFAYAFTVNMTSLTINNAGESQ